MKKNIPILIISTIAATLCIWWAIYTNFTAEDTLITFRYAQHVHEGNGFVFNLGERIYGTTTPLLTLLLAGWMFISKDLVLGSKLIDIAAFIGGLWFLYFALPYRRAAIIATSLIAVSMKLIAESMQGMETPLLFLFSMGAYWGYAKDRPYFSGIMCGLMLWTRIDAAVFVGAMFLSFVFFGTIGRLWTSTVHFTIGTLVYLPWIIFATLYFGSPIPHTVTAKIVAYAINNPPIAVHFGRIIDYISWPVFLLTILSILYVGKRNLFMAIFFTANIVILAMSGSTFMLRYFYTITIVSIVMISIMFARMRGRGWRILILLSLLYASIGIPSIFKERQVDRNEVLKSIGLWLNENTPEGATIQVESAGYIPFHADRVILDEVGLMTPRVVELRRHGIAGNVLYPYLKTDYVILQCHQGDGVMDDFSKYYEMIKKFENGHPRSCYEIFRKLPQG